MRVTDPFGDEEYAEYPWLWCDTCGHWMYATETDDWTCGYCGGMLVRCER